MLGIWHACSMDLLVNGIRMHYMNVLAHMALYCSMQCCMCTALLQYLTRITYIFQRISQEFLDFPGDGSRNEIKGYCQHSITRTDCVWRSGWPLERASAVAWPQGCYFSSRYPSSVEYVRFRVHPRTSSTSYRSTDDLWRLQHGIDPTFGKVGSGSAYLQKTYAPCLRKM